MFATINRRLEQLLSRGSLSPSSGMHLNCMDGLRGVAILMVVCCHSFYTNPNGPPVFIKLSKLIGTGWMGVPIFFVLSGFLISYPFFQSRANQRQFWYPSGYATRRALKIFPPFFLTIALLMIFYYARFQNASYFKVGLQWATGAAHYVNPALDFNGSFWSLWVEIHFYALLPVFFFLCRGMDWRKVCAVLFLLFALVPPIARALTWPAGASQGEINFFSVRFPNAVDSFAWGILLAGIYVGIKASSRPAAHLARWGYVGAVSLAGCAVAFTVIPFAPQTMIQLERMLPGLAAFLLALFIFDPTAIGARILSTPALRFIGMVSYEWFLIHQPMMSYARWLVSAQGKIWNYALILAVPWVISFGLAVLIYFGFSLPIMRWGRNRLAARRKASTAPQAPVTDGVSANPS